MKKLILVFTVLLFLFSISIWARMPDATNQFNNTKTTQSKIVKSAVRPAIPEGFTPIRVSGSRKELAPVIDNNQPETSRSRAGGVAALFEEDFETDGDLAYYGGLASVFALPSAYGDTEFGTRYTMTHTSGDLEGAYFVWYSAVGTPDVTVHVYDVVAGLPGTEYGTGVAVPWANITIGGYTYVDLSSNLSIPTFDCGEEFFITYTVDGGVYGTTQVNMGSDDGSTGTYRSLEGWGTGWGYMLDDWGTDYCFYIDAIVSYSDTWTSSLGKWQYFTDAVPPVAGDSSHSASHCWWADEAIDGGFTDYLKSPVFTFDQDQDYPLINLSFWMNIQHLRAGAGEGFIDETMAIWMTDVDDTSGDYWHIDSFNGYDGTNSWWCGVTDPTWAGGWGYGTNWDQWIETPEITLPAGVSYLDFMHRYDVEDGYDYCYVEISDDGWVTYDQLAVYNATDTTWAAAPQIDLGTTYAGLDVSIRFHVVTDGGWDDEDGTGDTQGAWFLDDVSVHDGARTVYFEDDADTNQNFIVNQGNYLWTRLFYDYDRDYDAVPPAEHAWEQVDDTTIFNGSLNVTDYAGKNIMMQIAVQVDDSLYAQGDGLYIDDIYIEGIDLPEFDIQTDFLVVPYPTTEGVPLTADSIKIVYHQAGFSESGTNARCDVVEDVASAFDYWALNAPGVSLGEYNAAAMTPFPPTFTLTAGVQTFSGWCDGSFEEARGDTYAPEQVVKVYPPGEFELGYNSREIGGFYYPTCTGAVTLYTPFTDGIFTARDTYEINGISHMVYNRGLDYGTEACLTFTVYEYNSGTPLEFGTQIYTEEICFAITPAERFTWIEIPFSNPPTVTGDYWVYVSGAFDDGVPIAHEEGNFEYYMLVDSEVMFDQFVGNIYAGHPYTYAPDVRYTLAEHTSNYYINTLINTEVPSTLNAPQNVTFSKSGSTFTMSWDAVRFASTYSIYSYTNADLSGTETLVASGIATLTHDFAVPVGSKLFYVVKAVK